MLQVNRFVTKSGEYVLAGFPLESVSKYIPEYDDLQEMEGGDLSITITLSDDMQQLSTEQLLTMFEEWKQDQPIKEGRKSTHEIHAGSNQAPTLARSGVFAIISEVLSYPVEQKTPAENIEFISKMKQSIVALL